MRQKSHTRNLSLYPSYRPQFTAFRNCSAFPLSFFFFIHFFFLFFILSLYGFHEILSFPFFFFTHGSSISNFHLFFLFGLYFCSLCILVSSLSPSFSFFHPLVSFCIKLPLPVVLASLLSPVFISIGL